MLIFQILQLILQFVTELMIESNLTSWQHLIWQTIWQLESHHVFDLYLSNVMTESILHLLSDLIDQMNCKMLTDQSHCELSLWLQQDFMMNSFTMQWKDLIEFFHCIKKLSKTKKLFIAFHFFYNFFLSCCLSTDKFLLYTQNENLYI